MREWPSRTIVSTICPGRRQRERDRCRCAATITSCTRCSPSSSTAPIICSSSASMMPCSPPRSTRIRSSSAVIALLGDVADAEQAGDGVGDRREQPDQRPQHDADQLDRAREDEREPLGVGERERLGHELAEQDRREAHEERHDEQREDVSRAREPEGDERVGERVRDARAGERRGEEADERDADLDRSPGSARAARPAGGRDGAPRLPSSPSWRRRLRRTVTSAISAATNTPFSDDEHGDDEELGRVPPISRPARPPLQAGRCRLGRGLAPDVTGRRIRAGTPTAILPAGTSWVTTEPAPV